MEVSLVPSPSLPPVFLLHTASDQKLEAGEACYMEVTWHSATDLVYVKETFLKCAIEMFYQAFAALATKAAF